jgi:type I restriction enzyme S subunit
MVERELPAGWEWKRLGEAADINMGQSPSGTSYNENGEGTPFLQGNAEFGDTFPEHKKFTTEPSKIASKGSVLISVRAPVGDTNIADLNYCIGRGLASISLKDGDNKFLLYLLRSMKPMIEAKGTGSTFKAISRSIINKIEIPIPPLPVQHQIVAILEQVEAVKRRRQKADALTGALLQSVFRELFGDPVRNEKGWEKAKISDITVFHKQGLYTDVNYADDGIRLIRITDITEDGHLNYSTMPFLSINDKLAEQFKVEQGDFLFARSGVSIGRCAIVESNIPCVFGSFIIKFQFNPKKIDNKFFLYLMRMPINQNQLKKFTHGSANPNVNADNIKNLEIFVPPLALQQQFARVVQDVERIREQQVVSGRQIEGLCEGLMARAFGGKLNA